VLLRPGVGNARSVRCRVAAYPVNQDGNPMKLSPRSVGSEDRSRPELLVAKVSNVGLAVSRCYENPVLVDEHDHIIEARARKPSVSPRATGRERLRRERWPLSSAVGTGYRSAWPAPRAISYDESSVRNALKVFTRNRFARAG
jgi:hypothetical protein